MPDSPAYPILANGLAVNQADIAAFMDAIFRHVDWSDGGLISILGIGEKGTRQEGVFRDRKFIDPRLPNHIDIMAAHARRWAEHEIATFIVPAVVQAASQLSNDVTLDKIAAFPAFVVDIDKGDPRDALEHIEATFGPATLLVASGGQVDGVGRDKLHAYWRFTEPATEIEQVAALRKTIAAKAGGDQAFGRATQVIRLPGSVHCKGGGARPVKIVATTAMERDLGDLAEAGASMPTRAGLEPPAASPAATGGMDFSGGAGRLMTPVLEALTHTIAEGGDGDQNRWLNFSRVAGLEIANVRKGLQTLETAFDLVNGWTLSKMVPPWPEARIRSEFTGLLQADVKAHGPFVAVPSAEASPSEFARVESIGSSDDLLSWAAWRRSSTTPPARKILVEGLIFSAKRHMLVAEGGAGKTFLCMDLALKLAAAGPDRPLHWLGQAVRPEAHGGTVVIMTGEDDLDELDIRWNAIDPGGALRQVAGDRLIALPLDNLGGAFPLVTQHPATREAVASPKWVALYHAMRGIEERGGRISAVIIDTLNSTLHGEENSAMVIGEYIRAVAPICGELKAALIVTHHVRKPGAEPIRSLEDMRDAIRGSTALPNAMRLVVGVWAAHDYERRMKAMGLRPQRQSLFKAGVVKANMPEAMRDPLTLMRDAAGLLQDVTAMDRSSRGPSAEAKCWLIWAITKAREAGAPFTRTASNGIYARRAQLPPMFHNLTRDGELMPMVDELLASRALILRPATNGGNGHTYLDAPEFLNATLHLQSDAGLDLKWRDHFYDQGWDEIRPKHGE